MDERVEQAGLLYERAVFGGDADALAEAERNLDAAEADLALARGRVVHARFLADGTEDPQELELFERAARLYRKLGDVRGEAESLFWVGTFHQVVHHDNDTAVAHLRRSRDLATQANDKLTLSYALRHLCFVDHAAGRIAAAREKLEESTALRRELAFLPGVAANLIGLAYLAHDDGQRDGVRSRLDEAATIADANGARGVLRWVEQARAQLLGDG